MIDQLGSGKWQNPLFQEFKAASIEAVRNRVTPEEPVPPYWPRTEQTLTQVYIRWQERQRIRAELTEEARIAREAAMRPTEARTDQRDAECIERWPDCWNGGYDPKCCRFPKSCSCGGEAPASNVTCPTEAVHIPALTDDGGVFLSREHGLELAALLHELADDTAANLICSPLSPRWDQVNGLINRARAMAESLESQR
jgi:hypothetical protein